MRLDIIQAIRTRAGAGTPGAGSGADSREAENPEAVGVGRESTGMKESFECTCGKRFERPPVVCSGCGGGGIRCRALGAKRRG